MTVLERPRWSVARRLAVIAAVALLAYSARRALPLAGRSVGRVDEGVITRESVGRAVVVAADGVAELRPMVRARVRAVLVREGDFVHAGQVIAELDDQSLQAEVDQRRAERDALVETTPQDTASARRAADARRAAATALVSQAETNLAEARMRAPLDAVVLARRVDVGDLVSPEGPVAFELADPSHLEVRFELEDEDVSEVTPGDTVTLTEPGGGRTIATASLARLSARMERRALGLDDARARGGTLVRAAWATLPGGAPVVIGQRLEAHVQLPAHRCAARAPRGAVEVLDGRAIVRVAWGPFARTVEVRLGLADRRYVELSGVAPGTTLVAGEAR